MIISLCEHKSGQMPQAVKQSLTWMQETRFPVSVNDFFALGRLFNALSKFKFLAAKHGMFEST